ncbi:MAG: HEAT repeat domain-containing protein [Planctomycetes bacterium]|nr:HEAT repeat domain-containing protein [Planctomycetota bacterium]
MRRLTIALVVLVVAGPVARGQAVGAPHRETVEFRVLERTRTFMSAAVGDGGETPAAVHALRLLLARPDAAAALTDVLERARHPAGRLFALAGLRAVDPTAFARAVDGLRGSDEPISFLDGCIESRTTVGAAVEALAAGNLADVLCGRVEVRLRPRLELEEACARLAEGGESRLVIDALVAHGPAAVPALREALRAGPAPAQAGAAAACERLGPVARDALPELLALVEAADDDVGLGALDAVSALSCWAVEQGVPALRRTLERAALPPARLVRTVSLLEHLVRGLGLLEPAPPPPWVRRTEHEDGEATYALVHLPATTIAALARALGDDDAEVGEDAANILGRAAGPAAFEPARAVLDDPRPLAREGALTVLAELALSHAGLRPAATAALTWHGARDPDERVRAHARDLLELFEDD